MKKYILMVVMALMMVTMCSQPVSAKGSKKTTTPKTVTITKSDDATLKKVNKQLKKGVKFYINVKGNKKNSKTLIKEVVKSIGAVNGYTQV